MQVESILHLEHQLRTHTLLLITLEHGARRRGGGRRFVVIFVEEKYKVTVLKLGFTEQSVKLATI
jgi:hypothetical protein